MKINKLIKDQAGITNNIQKMYLAIIQTTLEKHGIEKARDIIKDEIRKQMPTYVKDALQLGVSWLSEGEK